MIHSTAIIHPGAQLHESVRVGPYSVIDEHVTLGAGCELGPHVHLTGHTTIGVENRFHTGCVIGDAPPAEIRGRHGIQRGDGCGVVSFAQRGGQLRVER